jgi:S1-C subfamily serine protease
MVRSSVRLLMVGTVALAGVAILGGQARASIRIGVVLLDTFNGTEVTQVYAGSLARKMGLRTGAVLLSVNGEDVTSAEQFAGVLRKSNSIKVTWEKNGRTYRGWASKKVVTRPKVTPDGRTITEQMEVIEAGEGDPPGE